MSDYSHPSEADLLARLRNTEDSFTERKSVNDSRDWIKTIVAFANSVPLGHSAVLYIGARDNGDVEDKVNLDSVQKTLAEKAKDIYPPVFFTPQILSVGGKELLAVVVPGSPSRPHFAGPSFIRDGSITRVASQQQFDLLIAERDSKAYELRRWLGKTITMDDMSVDKVHIMGPVRSSAQVKVLEVNKFYLVCTNSALSKAIPLERIDLSFDTEKKQLKIEVYPTRK